MADFDFMNMFAPGGTPSGLDALFNEDQRRLMGRNANLSAAAALLQASGRSRERIEAFIKLGRKDPVQYEDETGEVSWDVARAHAEHILSTHNS